MRRVMTGFVGCAALIAAGCAGPAGPPGPPGVAGYEVVMQETAVEPGPTKQLRVLCPDGKSALGAGWSVEDPTSAILDGTATHFQAEYDGGGYLVNARNNSAFEPNWKLRVRVMCATIAE